MESYPKILVTGAAGFIGSHFVRLLRSERPTWEVHILDCLTYSGNLSTIKDIDVSFHNGRIEDYDFVSNLVKTFGITQIVNFAAETHNDRSLSSSFLTTNVLGVENLLNITKDFNLEKFLQVSTDEVYGSTLDEFKEGDALLPNSPYSASKASAELVCRAHHKAFNTPVLVTRGGNTYGPYQYPEKLVPFFTTRILNNQTAPLYGSGMQIREWMHVYDHCKGILTVLEKGSFGEAYNIGDHNERTNIDISHKMMECLGILDGPKLGLIVQSFDPRKGSHDFRYSMNTEKVHSLGWSPSVNFETGFAKTIQWYKDNESWWRPIIESDEYRSFFKKHYGESL